MTSFNWADVVSATPHPRGGCILWLADGRYIRTKLSAQAVAQRRRELRQSLPD